MLLKHWGLLALVTFLFVSFAVVAQEATPEAALTLEPCSSEQLTDINDAIEYSARQLAFVVQTNPAEHIYEITDDVTIEQRAYWDVMRLQTECLELYTRGYEFGRLLDEYSIAFGLASAHVAATAIGDTRAADRLEEQAFKHLRNAQRLLRLHFPEYLELLEDERFQ